MFKNAWMLAPILLLSVSVIVIGWYVTPKHAESFGNFSAGWKKNVRANYENKEEITEARERPLARHKESVTNTRGEGRGWLHENERDFLISGQELTHFLPVLQI